jgi:hypothetical protein
MKVYLDEQYQEVVIKLSKVETARLAQNLEDCKILWHRRSWDPCVAGGILRAINTFQRKWWGDLYKISTY